MSFFQLGHERISIATTWSERRTRVTGCVGLTLFDANFRAMELEAQSGPLFASMPIRAYLDGQKFDGETIRQMGIAFEMALASLGATPGCDDPIRRALAQRIIDWRKSASAIPSVSVRVPCRRSVLLSIGTVAPIKQERRDSIFSKLWWKLRYQFRPNSLHDCPNFVRDRFEDGRFNHVAMNGLQFGRH